MSGEEQDEGDRYITSLIEGTDYAKRKDHEARVRMVAKWYGVTARDVHAIEKALIVPIRGLIQETVANKAEAIVRDFVRLCRTSQTPDGVTTANPPTLEDVSKSEAHQQSAATMPTGAR